MNRIQKAWANIVYRIKMKRAVTSRMPIKTAKELCEVDVALYEIDAEYRSKR